MSESELRTTTLTAWHEAQGARMVPFAGFSMPVQYEGVLAEHLAVREHVGLFDVSHMGEIEITGEGAAVWLDGLVTNRVADIRVGKVVYTAMCREDGGVLDDILVYRLGEQKLLVVCNASNHRKIISWLNDNACPGDCRVVDRSDQIGMIAVQGPDSGHLLGRLSALAQVAAQVLDLKFYTAITLAGPGGEWVVSRTGYTGERGYELYIPVDACLAVWEELLDRGEDLQVVPVGLAARDTLRFEVGYCLYGHELNEEVSPLEAGISWAVKLPKESFVGREALLRQKEQGVPRRLVGLQIEGRAIARQGDRVLCAGQEVGFVTSGTFSPTLKLPLALALVTNDPQRWQTESITVDIRGRSLDCRQVPIPFLAARTKGDPRAERTLP